MDGTAALVGKTALDSEAPPLRRVHFASVDLTLDENVSCPAANFRKLFHTDAVLRVVCPRVSEVGQWRLGFILAEEHYPQLLHIINQTLIDDFQLWDIELRSNTTLEHLNVSCDWSNERYDFATQNCSARTQDCVRESPVTDYHVLVEGEYWDEHQCKIKAAFLFLVMGMLLVSVCVCNVAATLQRSGRGPASEKEKRRLFPRLLEKPRPRRCSTAT